MLLKCSGSGFFYLQTCVFKVNTVLLMSYDPLGIKQTKISAFKRYSLKTAKQIVRQQLFASFFSFKPQNMLFFFNDLKSPFFRNRIIKTGGKIFSQHKCSFGTALDVDLGKISCLIKWKLKCYCFSDPKSRHLKMFYFFINQI